MGLSVTGELGESKYKGVHRIEVASLREQDLWSVATCAWCVTDGCYEQLKAAVEENESR